MAASSQRSALFICLGNICRSPIAEAVFAHLAKEKGVLNEWKIDSAAIGDWHVGKNPDTRARKCMEKHGIPMNHKARQITHDDFLTYQYIFGMDESNMNDLKRLAPKSHKTKLEMLGSYDPQKQTIIRDPYYDSDAQGFEDVYEQCMRCCQAFLDSVHT